MFYFLNLPSGEATYQYTLTDLRLANCDWTQLPDVPVDADAWSVYRQALRDVTTQADPFAIVWPESLTS